MYERTNLVIKPGEMTDERASERASGQAVRPKAGATGMTG